MMRNAPKTPGLLADPLHGRLIKADGLGPLLPLTQGRRLLIMLACWVSEIFSLLSERHMSAANGVRGRAKGHPLPLQASCENVTWERGSSFALIKARIGVRSSEQRLGIGLTVRYDNENRFQFQLRGISSHKIRVTGVRRARHYKDCRAVQGAGDGLGY